MFVIEGICAAVVVHQIWLRSRSAPLRGVLATYFALFAAAWAGEETCIRAYGFYQYSPGYSVWLDVVPLLIPLIWPAVILSAHDLATRLASTPSRVPWLTAALVLADASFIEPIAVQAGLWSWNAPGLLGVPPIGVLGWAYFAGIAALALHPPRISPGWLLGAIVGAHALLALTWWGALRWVSAEIPWQAAVAVAAPAGLVLAVLAWRSPTARAVPAALLWSRVPASLVFVALLVAYGRESPALLAWAACFVPPWLSLWAATTFRPTLRPAPAR
ncbi:MAG: carotenoid biosynthesis protein [Myxococcota bacterium]